jgi:hypothetical protein
MARNMRYSEEMARCVAYWERIHAKINKSLPVTPTLVKGFWPISDWVRDHPCTNIESVSTLNNPDNATPEDDVDTFLYSGPAKD